MRNVQYRFRRETLTDCLAQHVLHFLVCRFAKQETMNTTIPHSAFRILEAFRCMAGDIQRMHAYGHIIQEKLYNVQNMTAEPDGLGGHVAF